VDELAPLLAEACTLPVRGLENGPEVKTHGREVVSDGFVLQLWT
jgi:hypothetical protein